MSIMQRPGKKEVALFLFDIFKDAMRGLHLLEKAKLGVKAGAPPPDIRTGCDLALGVDITRLPEAQKVLSQEDIKPVDIVVTSDPELAPLQMSRLVKEVDFGDYMMVRCGNMKITYEKRNGKIVNISGGGCPDIPYVTLKIVGTTLGDEARPPGWDMKTECASFVEIEVDTDIGKIYVKNVL
ncbi:MAG: DUF3343 domain-containing protein, partial [Thaumarchaeota archaeon]|nr:DUF3343 domain-containing protein [Nitrososphaerota archaeon]